MLNHPYNSANNVFAMGLKCAPFVTRKYIRARAHINIVGTRTFKLIILPVRLFSNSREFVMDINVCAQI